MRARISVGFFILGVLLLTVDPLAGQPGGGKFGRGGFGNFGQPGATPGAPPAPPQAYAVQPGGQPAAFQMQPGGFGQPGGGTRFQFQPGGGGFGQQPGGFGQPGGGGFGQPGGGGFSRGGGGGMDPEAQWSMMLRVTGGTDTLDFSRIPPESRQFIRKRAEEMGTMPLPESGVWNKSQFIEFATRNQEIVRAKAGGGQPGGFGQPGAFGQQPGSYGQPGGFGQQPGGFGQPGGGRTMSDEEVTRLFQRTDRNQDGRVSPDEASDKLKAGWNETDVNRDGFIDFNEYRVYISRTMGGGQSGGPPGGFPGMPPGGFPGQPGNDFRGTGEGGGFGGRGEKKAEDFSNVGIRYGKLPPGLPDWFAEYDTDKDGQVNMYEWRTVGGKTTAEFRELDANGDGLIAPLELIRLTATKAETERLLAIQDGEVPQGTGQGRGSKGGSMSGGGGPGGFMGKGGFPGGGGGPPGGFNGFGGKGGPPSAEGGGERERGGKGGEKMDRGKNNPFANGGRKGN